MAGPQLWTLGLSHPAVAARMAEHAEAAGWDGMLMVDSQNLAGDTYVGLTLAAQATSTLRLGTGVTNPYTRHPAVTAAAIASVQMVSGGRAILGIGRGDSSLAYLGLAPAPVDAFATYLERLQAYLRGEAVDFAAADGMAPVSALGLAATPTAARLEFLPADLPKVPVDVAATGPKVIAAAARHADRITFAVGADPERVRWAIDTARAAAPDRAGDLSLGAYVNVVAHDDLEMARALASGGMASFARFSVMHGRPTGPVDAATSAVLTNVHRAYDMTRHTRAGTPQAEQLTPEFADRFGIVGPPEHCVRRLRELIDLGLDHLAVIGPTAGVDRTAAATATQRLAAEVLPALR